MSSKRPTPPDSLPAYVADPIERQDPATLETIQDYVADLLAYQRAREREQLADDDLAADNDELVDVEDTDGGTEVVKKVPCGKQCSGCPHGPYKYIVRRDGDSVTWEYRGPIET